MLFHMLGIRRTQLQVHNAIVCGIAIYVVYALLACQFSSEMLFHDKAVLKDSLAIHADSYAACRGQTGLPLFALCPIGGNVVIRAMPKKTSTVLSANSSVGFIENSGTAFDGTYLPFHDYLLENR